MSAGRFIGEQWRIVCLYTRVHATERTFLNGVGELIQGLEPYKRSSSPREEITDILMTLFKYACYNKSRKTFKAGPWRFFLTT